MRARLLGRKFFQPRVFGGNIEDTYARAALWRRQRDAVLLRFAARAVDTSRCLTCIPDFIEHRTQLTADARDAGRWTFFNNYRAASMIVASDDPTKGCLGHAF